MGKETELIKAAKRGDLRVLERYLSQQNKRTSVMGSIRKPMHPNVQDELGYTLLHHATLNGHTEVVSFLLSCGASTTIPDSSGSYPLHLASWKGDLEIVKLLVSHGMSRPNVDQQSNSEDTALHLASQYGYSNVVEFLLERHANPMLKNVRGETPLDLASLFGHLDTVHVLISHCPELLTFSRPETSSLHLAARNGHTLVALSLINAGISVNTMCTGGTALHEAAMCGKEETVKLLLDKGIDPSLKDSKGKTALTLLSEIPSKNARKIHQLISQYTSKACVAKERYMKPRKYRILAIPVRDFVPPVGGDIGKKETTGTVVGPEASDGNCNDSETREGGTLPQLEYHKDESIVIQGRQSPETYIGILHKVIGTFPVKDMRMFQDINGKLHEVTKDEVIEFTDDGDICVRGRNSLRKSRSATGDGGEKKKDKAKSKRQHKMTDQEKKFVLSKDTGTYSQLVPVSAPSTESAEIKQISPPPTNNNGAVATDSQGKEFLGNYYLLEVGSMETTPPSSPENKNSDQRNDIPSPPNYPAPHLRDDIPPPPIEAPPQPAVIFTKLSSRQVPNYENVELIPSLPPKKKRTKSFGAPQTESSLSLLPPERPRSKTNRTSGYENIPNQFDAFTGSDWDGLTSPVSIPQDEKKEARFHIVEDNRGSKEDVVISSLNPNYMKVELKNRPRPIEHETEEQDKGVETHSAARTDSPGESVWFIPHQENNPFAGLVQSSSVPSTESFIPRERLQSIWDDRRVSNEWTQINDFIASMNDTIIECESNIPNFVTEATPTSEEKTACTRSPVSRWLGGMRLEGLSNVFESNGFDDMDFMGGNILTVAELQEMGIHGDDQTTIAANMTRLRPPPYVRDCQCVREWLDALHLTFLKDYFEGYSLEKVSQLWEMQLLNVLGVEELGYRKRLLYGINELRSSHPEWYTNTNSGNNIALQLREESGHTSSVILQQANFTKDYRNIKSLKSQNGSSVESLPLQYNDEDIDFELKWVESNLNRAKSSHSTSSLDKHTVTRPHPSTDALVVPVEYQDMPQEEKDDVTNGEVITRTRTSHSTSSLEKEPRYKKVPLASSNKGRSTSANGEITPTSAPIRGYEYATVRQDDGNQGLVVHQERKRVAIATPPTRVHNYNTWYLGSSMVKGMVGKHSAEEACLKLRTQTDGIAKIPQIVLSISWKGVKFVDAESKMVVSNHLIRDISHCCPDIEDTRVFAYMTKEKETGRSYCHVFMAESKEVAEEIISTVGQAFEDAYQAVVRARGHRSMTTTAAMDSSSNEAATSGKNTSPKHKKSPIKSSLKSSFRKLNPRRKSSSAGSQSSKDVVS